MAHFAELDENNEVIWVTVVSNNELLVDGIESEAKGIEFLQHLGQSRRWVQTSYNANFRKNYAGIGYSYNQEKDAFIPPKPYQSWLLNEEICDWYSPVPHPENSDKSYVWNEEILNWEEISE